MARASYTLDQYLSKVGADRANQPIIARSFVTSVPVAGGRDLAAQALLREGLEELAFLPAPSGHHT